MKTPARKIPAMIGMGFAVISIGLVIAALILACFEDPEYIGPTRSFAFWIYSIILAFAGMLSYIVDAVFCLLRPTRFHILLAAIIFLGVPMLIFVGCRLGINILIWNLYFLSIFVLEVIDIRKHRKGSC